MNRVRAAIAAGVVAAVALTVVVVLRGTSAGAAPAPGQVISVRATSAAARVATVEAWERQPDGAYKRVYGPIAAFIGAQGIGKTSETLSRTPAGVFTLTQAFGINRNPGSGLPYKQVDSNDWWVSDVNSPKYNTYARCAPATCPFNIRAAERLGTAGPVYGSLAVIDYNRSPVVRGAGSAFFLHVSNGRPTAGCVAIPAANLVTLLRWLKPAQRPVISLGVGTAAYAPMPTRV